jgi:hypothetical protein
MTKKAMNESSKAKLLWDRFEKSGSIQAYLRFRKARQSDAGAHGPRKSESPKKGSSKRVVARATVKTA